MSGISLLLVVEVVVERVQILLVLGVLEQVVTSRTQPTIML